MSLKRICAFVAALLLAGSTVFSFAAAESEEAFAEAETSEAAAPVIRTVGGLSFTGPTITLSLEEALEIATTGGASAQEAELKKKSDEASAKSNSESASNMKSINKENSDVSYSRTEIAQAQKARDYYNTMAERNYEAAMNQINYNIQKAYYSLLHAEESVRIAEESLAVQETLLAATEKKYQLGVSAKQDVLQAEISVNSARSSVESAELQLAEKKMDMNAELGYDQMQDVQLTTSLEMAEASEIALGEALESALENRNELYSAAYSIYTAEQNLNEYAAYPKSSAKYLTAYNSYNSALKSYDDRIISIQKEIRIDYANMMSARRQVETARLSAEKAKESFTIYQTKYDLGMVTLSDVQQAQIDWSSADQSYASAILSYNLAVLNYELAATVGTSSN